ncbi:accessory regulator T protein [Streptococcus pseudopneumoniae]|nr:accessory regulator T protein [Streptococcus pseudopneumoniae]TMR53621.1 accessory regulator T protein [Streptococcus pseudopneumoniae]TMR59703.1 accessory regulator T protein [Streptococcus pseudopneumoniae]
MEYFFCKTLDIFLKHDKIIVVGRIKSLSNKNKMLYKEIFANEQSGNCKKSHRCLGWT